MPVDGLMCDIMWSDPDGLIHLEINGFNSNPRGAGFTFGGDIVDKFNKENNIILICRAHQLIMEGYKFYQ